MSSPVTALAEVADDPSASLPLSQLIGEIEQALAEGRGEDVRTLTGLLENVVADVGLRHVQFCEAGRLALVAGRFEMAERFAKRSLLSFPKYGLAYYLLGDMFSRMGQGADAAPCYRYFLPQVIRERWFDEGDCTFVDSSLEDGAGIERFVAFPGERHPLGQPLQTIPVAVPDLDHDELVSAEAYVGVVPGGRLWYDGGNAVVWDREGRIVEDLGMGFAPLVQASVQERTPVRLAGRVCLLGNRSWQNYYHWMCDSMPRLDVLEAAGLHPDSIDRFVIMPPCLPFHADSLALAGIGEERLHTTQAGEYIEADELIMPVFGSSSLGLRQGAWTPRGLARRFGPTERPARGRRLFVSRGTTGKRGIVNEPELLAALAPLGFETVRCEMLSLSEQATMFASAEVVLGPHGAGLTNIIFCAEDTLVVELFNAHMAACFWTISELIGLRHVLHFCGHDDARSALPGSDPQRSRAAIDIRRNAFEIDVAVLVGALAGLGVDTITR